MNKTEDPRVVSSKAYPHLNLSKRKAGLLAIPLVAILGVSTILFTHAESTSSISGYAFKDVNRNGVKDAGEEPYVGQVYYVADANYNYLDQATTDATGKYTVNGLAPGTYVVTLESTAWWALRDNWTPTTLGGSIQATRTVDVTTSANVNFGFRQIVRSTDLTKPISEYVSPGGMHVQSFNDVVPAQKVYEAIAQGLIGEEQKYITIRFDYSNIGSTVASVQGAPGSYSNYNAVSYNNWATWIDSGPWGVMHEYGHAWSGYYGYIVQQQSNFENYLKARGLQDDPRINTSYAWSTSELIAEDYRELLGGPQAYLNHVANTSIPLPADVPGLKEYLSGAFMKSPADIAAPNAPTSLTGTGTLTTEGYGTKLSWTASTDNIGVSKYEVYRNGVPIGYVSSPTTNFFDTNLAVSTSYQYYVKAIDTAGNASTASSTITVKTPAPDTAKPLAPTNLTLTGQTTTTISLKWNASTDNVAIKEYRVYKVGGNRKTGSTSTLLASTANTNYTVPSLSSATSYSYFVTAVDTAGNESLASNTLTAKTLRR